MKILVALLSLLLFINYSIAITPNDNTHYKQKIEKNVYLERKDKIESFTFDELVKLSQTEEPNGELKEKLDKHLSKVFVVNRNFNSKLEKSYLRVLQWNIKRGLNADQIKEILVNPSNYEASYTNGLRKKRKKELKEDLSRFSSADILCFNEVDIGMPRTKYKNIAAYLADKLNWNYAYSTEFIELGPLFQKQNVDKEQYKGLHGNLIVSRFPIISERVIPLPNFYDWYKEETKKRQSPLERFRKFGAKAIFSQLIEQREVRHGNRNALVVDIKLPNDKVVTIITTHLEDRTYPDLRLKQFKYLLENIKDIKNPVILAGDFNTSTTDTAPTSMKKEVEKRIRDPHFLLRQAAFIPVPFVPVVGGLACVATSKLLQYKDPFFPNIPVIFPNHERKFYTYLKMFRFKDGYGFDLSGDKKRSGFRRGGLLANSNQRHWKGFKSTYKLEKPRIIAYFKLDWFFIKPVGNFLLPFNPKTLKVLNRSFKGGISDHNPITVDLKL